MKKILFILLLLAAVTFCYPEKLAELPEVIKPGKIIVTGERVYIAAETTIFMYGMKDFKFLKQFVEKGEGPAEAKFIDFFKAYPDFLTLECGDKIMYFSLAGDYIKEKRVPKGTGLLSHFGKNFVGRKLSWEEETGNRYYTLNILDQNFKSIGRLYRGNYFGILNQKGKKKKILNFLSHHFFYHVYRDKIFVVDTRKGFYIVVFNSEGKQLYEINKGYKKIKVPQSFKDQTIDKFKKFPNWEDMKTRFKFAFLDYYPAVHFSSFRVADDKIYAFTYETRGEEKNKKRELVILDLKGKVLKRIFLPVPGETAPLLMNKSYIYKDMYYYLFENEDKEMWELHAVELK